MIRCPTAFVHELVTALATDLAKQKVCKSPCTSEYIAHNDKSKQIVDLIDIQHCVEDLWLGNIETFSYNLSGTTATCRLHPTEIYDSMPMVIMQTESGETFKVYKKTCSDMNVDLWNRSSKVKAMFLNKTAMDSYTIDQHEHEIYIPGHELFTKLCSVWLGEDLSTSSTCLLVNPASLRHLKKTASDEITSCRFMISGDEHLFAYLYLQTASNESHVYTIGFIHR